MRAKERSRLKTSSGGRWLGNTTTVFFGSNSVFISVAMLRNKRLAQPHIYILRKLPRGGVCILLEEQLTIC